MSDLVLLERMASGIVRLTFNRPDSLNAMDEQMGDAFLTLLDELRGDDNVRALIVTGAGRAFSAGGNLQMLEDHTRTPPHLIAEMMEGFYRRYLKIREAPFPTIAAINGFAVGAGLCIAMACDLRIASQDARMAVNFTKLGFGPGMGTTWSLPRLIGRSAALDLILTGRTIEADEALNLGLVNQVVAGERLLETAQNRALQIAENAPIAVRIAKKLVYENESASLDEALAREATGQAMTFGTQDALSGVQAVRSKKKAEFTNR